MREKRIHPAIAMLGADIIMALIIILIGMIVCVSKLSEIYKMIIVSAGPIEASSDLRTDISTYYALNGEWPDDKKAILELLPYNKTYYQEMESPEMEYRRHKHVLAKGAIHVTIKKLEKNNRVTLRPAVPTADPLGPVIWITGKGEAREGWTVIGEDQSTIDERYINKALK
ncbi:MAG: hypothetical protein OEV42_19545 [Deltaproteobacteria bacterium]|nr:hypothetical protein [Deltaproteobacteria bacterium]